MVSKSHGGFGFRHLKLVWKLVAVLALVVGPLMGAILYSSVLSRKIEHEIADVRDLHSPVIIAAMTLQSELQASLIHLRDYLLTGESKHEALRAADWARIEAEAKRYDLLSQGFTVTASIARWKALRERLAETKKVQDAIASRHSPGSIGSAETVAALYNLAAPASSAALAIIRGKPDGKGGFEGGLIVSQQELLHTEISDAFELTHHSNIIALWLLAAAIGVAFLGVLILLRGVSRPLSRITEAMNAVAGHNYEVTIPAQDQRDEVGDMARALSVFRDGLEANERLEVEAKARLTTETERQAKIGAAVASFEKAAEAVVLTVSSAATELEAAASDLTAAASKATAEASSVAAAAEEATANVNGVAAAGEELAATASEIARLLQSTRDSADASAGQMRAADGNVQELALAARKIGEIVHLIDGLAGQTNLLALNATIEAARAGEAGRGFAVVASEVKELANQTARATSEISDMVQRIQGVTESTVSAIQDVDQGIQTISGSTAEISGAVSQQESATREIARNVHETAKGVEEVNRSIAFVSSAANSTAAASSQVFAAAGELAQQAETMRKEVQCFLDAVRAA